MPTLLRRLPLLMLMLMLTLTAPTLPTYAAGVVGSGTPASCTEAALAVALAGSNTITFSCGGPVTIPITTQLRLTRDTAIDGGGQITLDAGGRSRVFVVEGANVTIAGLTITRGDGAGGSAAGRGAGLVLNRGSATLDGVTFTRNRVAPVDGRFGDGGAVYVAEGTLRVRGGRFAANEAAMGGAIYNYRGRVELAGVTLTGNTAGGGGAINNLYGTVALNTTHVLTNTATTSHGGGILNFEGALTVDDSRLAGNRVTGPSPDNALGAGIYSDGSAAVVALRRSTFAANSGFFGGGILNDRGSTLTVEDSVFEGNSAYDGAGIYNNGSAFSVTRTRVLGNTALRADAGGRVVGGAGGGIFNGSTAWTLTDSLIDGNRAGTNGGGIFNASGGVLTIQRSAVTNNRAGSPDGTNVQGGGIASYGGGVTVEDSTIARNALESNGAAYSTFGGGIYSNNAPATLRNVTVANNVAPHGAGGGLLLGVGTLRVQHVTLAGNQAAYGSAIHTSGQLTLANSIVAGNTGAGKSCSVNQGSIANGGGNVQHGDTSCGADVLVANPLLTALADNGGLTPTLGLPLASPARHIGVRSFCLPTDQRGAARPPEGCAAGAFEPQTALSVAPSIIVRGAPDTLVTLQGDGFSAGDVVMWGDQELSTTYVSPMQLRARVPAAALAAEGSIAVRVKGSALTPATVRVVAGLHQIHLPLLRRP